jgi:L-glyceraldehyde 3-phosphate reductase
MTYIAADNGMTTCATLERGRSGLLLPKISLGLWNNFGNDRPIEGQRAILRRAFDPSMIHFDLANNHGPPDRSAESNFGRILSEDFASYRDETIVSSKPGYYMWPGPYREWGSRKATLASLDQSLTRLGLDSVDILYSHRPDPGTPIEETMGALASAARQGKALYVGISNYYQPDEARAATAALRAEGIPLTIDQPRYNMFDRRIEAELLDTLRELGRGAIAFSPLAQGLATNRYLSGVPSDSRAAEGRWLDKSNVSTAYLERAQALNTIAIDRGQTLAQLATSWVLRQPETTSALVGASSVAQLEDSLHALEAAPLSRGRTHGDRQIRDPRHRRTTLSSPRFPRAGLLRTMPMIEGNQAPITRVGECSQRSDPFSYQERVVTSCPPNFPRMFRTPHQGVARGARRARGCTPTPPLVR